MILLLEIVFLLGCPTIDFQKAILPKNNYGECGSYIYEIEHVPLKSSSCIFPFSFWNDAARENELLIEFSLECKSDIPIMDLESVSIVLGNNLKEIAPFKFEKEQYHGSMYTDGLRYNYKKIANGSNVQHFIYYFDLQRKKIRKFTLKIPGLKDFCPIPEITFKRSQRIKFRVWVGH